MLRVSYEMITVQASNTFDRCFPFNYKLPKHVKKVLAFRVNGATDFAPNQSLGTIHVNFDNGNKTPIHYDVFAFDPVIAKRNVEFISLNEKVMPGSLIDGYFLNRSNNLLAFNVNLYLQCLSEHLEE